jgi:hypothetical protein
MNQILKTSLINILNKKYGDIYKLEIYKNGNVKIINQTDKTEYFSINDNIEIPPNLINTYLFLFETTKTFEQLKNFVSALQCLKNNLKFDSETKISNNNSSIKRKSVHSIIDNKEYLKKSRKDVLDLCNQLKLENNELKSEINKIKIALNIKT